jgi:hypothetical protein
VVRFSLQLALEGKGRHGRRQSNNIVCGRLSRVASGRSRCVSHAREFSTPEAGHDL